jgi:hypothetical protein
VKLTIVDDCTQVLQEKMNDVWYRVYTCIHTHVGIFCIFENLIYLKIEPCNQVRCVSIWYDGQIHKCAHIHEVRVCSKSCVSQKVCAQQVRVDYCENVNGEW